MAGFSIIEYHEIHIQKSLRSAKSMTGIGASFVFGLLIALLSGWMGEFFSGFDGEFDKSLKMVAYTAISMILIWFVYIVVHVVFMAPFLLWRDQKDNESKLKLAIGEMEENKEIMPFDIEWQNTTHSMWYEEGNSVSYPIILHSKNDKPMELDVNVHLISDLESRWFKGGKITVNPASSYTEHLLVGLPKTIDKVVYSSKIIKFYSRHIPNSEFRWNKRPLQLVWWFSHPEFTSKEFSLYIYPSRMGAKLAFGNEVFDRFDESIFPEDNVTIQHQRPEHWVDPKKTYSHGVKYEPKESDT